jgi:copper chaperone
MNAFRFKSTIKCTGCINTVRPELDNLKGLKHWEVDLTHPDRILTVEAEGLQPQQVVESLQAVGYKAELLKD